jgi:predicted  nucleic acid-binding Zn-ribbon protein
MPHQCIGCGHTFDDGSKEMLSGCPECGGNKFQFRPTGADFPADPEPAEIPKEDTPPDPDTPSSVTETVGRATTRVRDFVSTGEPASDLEEDRDGPNPGPDPKPKPEPDSNATWPSEAGEESGDQSEQPSSTAVPEEDDVAGNTDRSTGDGSGSTGDGSDIIDADAHRTEAAEEDVAQTSARSDVVSSEELSVAGGDPSPRDESPGSTREHAADSGDDSPTETSPDTPTPTPSFDSDGRVLSQPTDEDPDISELREQLNDQFESIKIVEPGQYELNLMELYDREEYIIALQENGRYVIQVPEQWIGDEPGDH